jgi:hypothetical protein
VRLFLLMLFLAAPLRAEPRGRAADATAWARLTERARLRPTSVEKLMVGANAYEVSVVALQSAAVERQCPAEMAPRVTFYLARPVTGPGGEVYPARLTVQCVSAEFTRQEAAVDMGLDGTIRDGTLYDPASNKFLTLDDKAKLTPKQKARLDALLAGAVARLLASP